MTVVHRWWDPDSPTPPPDTVLDLPDGWTLHDWTHPADDASDSQVSAAPRERHRHRANVVRLRLLTEHGGMWLDHDLTPLLPLDELPSLATLWRPDYQARAMGFLSFPAGHPLLTTMLAMIDACGPNPQAQSFHVSGGALLTAAAGDEIARVPIDQFTQARTARGEVMTR